MRPDQYTADAICLSLGLHGFIDPTWKAAEPAIRLLFKPSFHPEVCVTLVRRTDRTDLLVVVALSQVWLQPAPGIVPSCREQHAAPADAFAQVASAFAEAEAEDAGNWICVDGMGVEGCLLTEAGLRRFRKHAFYPPVRRLAALALSIAWDVCRDARARNGLAAAARYVGIEYPHEPEPAQPSFTQIAVLGTPDDRADFFQLLNGSKKAEGRTVER